MKLLSVNRSEPREVELAGRTSVTGIVKEPVDGSVSVAAEGLDGDGVGNTKDHGGPDQAVYLYGTEDLDWWSAHGVDVGPGLFGENLTVTGLASAAIEVGDRFVVGDVLLEATAPRIPCATLSARVGDGDFKSRFADARRPGVY
ncbi:MAG: MOSC domain-containing protein, partial [Actinomycetota bacterium]